MNLTKKEREEVTKVYDTWLNSYLTGDVETYDSFFDDRYHFIGSTGNEHFLDRRDTTEFFANTGDQFAGKTKIKNNTRTIEKFEGLIFVTEIFDTYFLIEGDWTYYGKFRFTSALRKNKEGWRFIYQHFSMPDTKAEEGETIGTQKIAAENQILKEAVKRRTIELEHKTRELEIESALERVRTAAMAMQKPDDLMDVCQIISEQLENLDVDNIRNTQLAIIDEARKNYANYQYFNAYSKRVFEETNFEDNRASNAMVTEMQKSANSFFIGSIQGEELQEFREWRKKDDQYPDPLLDEANALHYYFYSIGKGGLGLTTYQEISEESLKIFKRFHKIFTLAYRRFLDIQQAEAQAREAQVELALERIRAMVANMQNSEELLGIMVKMRAEFVSLGHEAHYFWHMKWMPDKYLKAMTSGDGTQIGMVMELPRKIHGEIPSLAAWEKSDEPTVVHVMDVKATLDYVHKMVHWGDFKLVDPNMPTEQDIHHIGGLTYVMARTLHGEIGYSLPGMEPHPPEEDLAILVRFAAVFDLAYRRFEDLKNAEARTKEALKQASLDRVRAQVATMRKPDDLKSITPLIWMELNTLQVPFFRCGVFIINEKEENVHVYLTTPDGKPLAALHLAFDFSDLTKNTIASWQENKVYQEHWNREEFIAWTHEMMKLHQVNTPEEYQGDAQPPVSLHLHFIPFAQGMLYVGNTKELEEEKIQLVRSLADAFSYAYARYEDFIVLEDAKQRIEKALNDLKATQSQLVHAEKMASLGELTAGIAHEIQNPLNFVNNFSEVSIELMEELAQESALSSLSRRAKRIRDQQSAGEIMVDIRQNLEKINHHGKRASGIVKSMLEHSRAGSGDKVPTDINTLADEYLRLSYHGLRAKDKSFSADFKLEADADLPNVNVVPQDIGRVLLNLINNAFYAVSAKALATADNSYKPTVIVKINRQSTIDNRQSTMNQPPSGGLGVNWIEIRITDNGNGIPDDIKEKIFQPFFTTKPTGEGTGLGLSMSYDIITKGHGGELKVETKEGEGTEFIILIPLLMH
jgi:signal transduction histidine kinase